VVLSKCQSAIWNFGRTGLKLITAWLDEKVIYESGWSLPVGVNKEDSHGVHVTAYAATVGTPKKPALNLNLARISHLK